jgi:hypothetical protein
MKIRKGRFSGKLGLEVYVNSQHGQVVRSRSRRRWRPTAGRLGVQHNMGKVVNAWRKLTRRQYEAWRAAAQDANMNTYPFFSKINGALAAAKLPLLMDPPKPEKFQPNPVGELQILNRGGVITLRVRVPRAPAQHTMVLGSRSCSRGIWTRGNKFAIIGALPAAVRGWSDITELYVARFGVPPVGSLVFIRTRQLINGWEDDFKETCADVPPPEQQGRQSNQMEATP